MTVTRRTSSAELRERILGAVRSEPSPPRRVQARRKSMLIAFGFAVAGAIALVEWSGIATSSRARSARLWHVVAEGQVPAHDPPLGFVVTLVATWTVVALLATWAGGMRGRSMLGRPWGVKIAVATVTPIALAVTWLGAALVWRGAVMPAAWLEAMTDDGVRFHVSCALMSLLYAAGPLLAFFAVRRHRDPVSAWPTGGALGAVAGAWGAVVHVALCSCTSPLHMALGHVLPVVLSACIGAIAAPRVLAVRPAVRQTVTV